MRRWKSLLRNRRAEIVANRAANPHITQNPQTLDFGKIKVGAKTLDDAALNLNYLKKVNSRLADRSTILRAIDNRDIKTMREVSEFFCRVDGIYSRMLKHMAFLYNYDWFLVPFVNSDKIANEKTLQVFNKGLKALDEFKVKKVLGSIALSVMKFGAYYGYRIETSTTTYLQELDANYCRSRLNWGNKPTVEFNMKYFDDLFRNDEQRLAVLKLFPAEFSKGYNLYRQGKLPPAFAGDTKGWYLLDPTKTVRFTLNGEEYPPFIAVIPQLLDLDEAQELDKKKMAQKLLKLIIQKMPLDKNGEMIFDIDETQQFHNNVVQMIGKAIGLDVVTSFADIEVASMTDSGFSSGQTDELEKVERQVFNEWGGSQLLFNTDGNIALEKSVINDGSTVQDLVLQFEEFLNEIVNRFSSNKIDLRVQILPTTKYNYQELSKLYKEQMQLGFSKLLPSIALGQSQSVLLATAFFENDVLDLANILIPPMSSNTMSSKVLETRLDDKKAGRKEKPDDQKTEKTIMNKESAN